MVRWRRVPLVLLLGLTQLLWAAPADATIVFREHYADTFAFSYDDCGFTVNVEGEFSGTAHIRAGKNKTATAFFLHDNFQYRETHTNPDTGESFTIFGNGLFQEVKAIPLGGNVFQFVAIEAGRPFTLITDDGTVVARDRGVIRYTVIFDTEGDDQPGGIFIDEFEPRISGPHPGFFLSDEDFCALLE